MKRIFIGLLAATCMTCGAFQALAQEQKPNIVVMLMDNLGWGEIGAYGGGILRGAETPRLDNLAAEGMRFLNFNVETQCTPHPICAHDGASPNSIRDHQSGLGAALWHDSMGSHPT